jgi:hypothetical protein
MKKDLRFEEDFTQKRFEIDVLIRLKTPFLYMLAITAAILLLLTPQLINYQGLIICLLDWGCLVGAFKI